MKARGNKNSKWFTCAHCQSRWERLEMTGAAASTSDLAAAAAEQPIHERDLVGFGKFAALSYRQLLDQQPEYCEWVLSTIDTEPDSCPALFRLGNFLNAVMTGTHSLDVSISTPCDSEDEWAQP